jgi:hypothetical protein
VVDFDGDGIPDILSGSWPGELYFFRGQGKGKFAAPEELKDKDGQIIKTGSASTVFAHDWNGDGRLDLVVGSIEGHVWLILNEGGSAGKHAFAKAVKLQADGKDIQVPHGDSHAIVADWDRDGKPDLLLGCGDGSVRWHRNLGSKTEPKLDAERILLAAPPNEDKPKPGSRGSRAKVSAVDWNGDGWLDLLVGDFSYSAGEPPQLTDAEKAAIKDAEKKYEKIIKELTPYFEDTEKLGPPPKDAAERAAWKKKVDALRAKHQKTFDEMLEVQKVLDKGRGPARYDGFVWLLLSQPPKGAAQR